MSNAEAAAKADTLILMVKPQDMAALLEELAPHVPVGRLVVTGAAGITTHFIASRLAEGVPVVRVMTNTPVLVDEAMSAISAGAHATEEHLVRTEQIFAPVGKTIRVPEAQQDAVTALSGSGPAYFYYLVEAMTDAGILLGLPRAAAARPDRAGRHRRRGDAARLRRAPGEAARGGHLPGRHHHLGHPHHGGPRGARGDDRGPGGRSGPVAGAGFGGVRPALENFAPESFAPESFAPAMQRRG